MNYFFKMAFRIGVFGIGLLAATTQFGFAQNDVSPQKNNLEPTSDLAQQEIPNTQKLEIPMTPANEALAMLTLPRGFKATLFAAEPDIHQPIAATFDLRGRLWVVECYTYSDRQENYNMDLNDRVVIFEDTDNNGVFDKRTVFWDQGKKLTGIELGFGGVWLTAAPNLIFIPDKNRDDKPDGPPEILLDGFEDDRIRHNIVNGLRWGPDGWLYGRHGIMATSLVGRPGATESQRTPINCGIWRIHPDSKKFEVVAHGGTNPWGFDFDKYGEMFMINTVIGHLFHVVPGARYRRMYGSHFNPHTYQVIGQTADHFHWDTSNEGWTKAKKGSLSDATDEAGGGHAHCGLMIYQGLNWPDEYRDKLYTANFHGRRINCDTFHREGNSYIAHHGKDHFKSGDPWFRGVELLYGPHGGVYVLDWSDIGECHENDGIHRTSGRIFKITYGETKKNAAIDIEKLSLVELVALQLHRNEWFVRKSRRRLQEIIAAGRQQDQNTIEETVQNIFEQARSYQGHNLSLATRLVKSSRFMRQLEGRETEQQIDSNFFSATNVTDDVELVRLRMLWLKQSCELATPKISNTPPSQEHVQAWAVRMLTDGKSPIGPNDYQSLLTLAKSTPSGLVRLYLSSGLRRLDGEQTIEMATALASHADDNDDRVQPHLLWYGVEPHVIENHSSAISLAIDSKIDLLRENICRRIAGQLDRKPEIAEELLVRFAQPVIAANSRKRKTDDEPNIKTNQAQRSQCLAGISKALEGWNQAKEPKAWNRFVAAVAAQPGSKDADRIRSLNLLFGDQVTIEDLYQTIRNNQASTQSRRKAIETLGRMKPDEKLFDALKPLVKRLEFTESVIKGFDRLDNAEIPGLLLNQFESMEPAGQKATVDLLVGRQAFAKRLLVAVEDGLVSKKLLTASHARRLANFHDAEIDAKLEKVWGSVRSTSAEKRARIDALRSKLTDKAIETGEMLAGQKLFKDNCANCHVLKGQGGLIGPDLTGADRKNLNYLLENIVDPSSSVADSYRAANVLLFDGRLLDGIVINETERTMKLQTKDALLTIDQEDVELVQRTKNSLMPEGLLDKLTDTEIRSLMKFLRN